MTQAPLPASPPAVGIDTTLGFTIPARDSRGRVVRLGPVLDRILSAHDYPPVLAQCLAEALVMTALMGSMLKDEGDQLTMQAQSDRGLVSLLVCDYRAGELRGYLKPASDAPGDFPNDAPPEMGALDVLFAGGHLAITFDIGSSASRYQGIVPLEGASFAAAVESYFTQSEQLPTFARAAVRRTETGWIAGGLLVQHLPEGEVGRERLHVRLDHPEWEHVSILAASIKDAELTDLLLPLEDIVWRLFHEEPQIRIEPGKLLARGCRCTEAHFESVLARFAKADRREMADENGIILVDCAFCSKQFQILD